MSVVQSASPEKTRVQRLMDAVRNLPSIEPTRIREPRYLTDPCYWRRIAWSNGISTEPVCDCHGGMRMVPDSHGGVEWDVCTRCDAIPGPEPRLLADLTDEPFEVPF